MKSKSPPQHEKSHDVSKGSDGTVEKTSVTREISASYSGPLPPASQLEAYNRIDPTFAERIVSMAEGYAAHTQRLESKLVDQERSDKIWARNIAAGVVIAILVTCIWALYLDKDEFALRLGSWTVVALAGVFIAGKLPDWIRNWGSQNGS